MTNLEMKYRCRDGKSRTKNQIKHIVSKIPRSDPTEHLELQLPARLEDIGLPPLKARQHKNERVKKVAAYNDTSVDFKANRLLGVKFKKPKPRYRALRS
jgi:hypothetical protein